MSITARSKAIPGVKRAARQARSPVVGYLARLGMVCAGVLYVVVGVLAIEVAAGRGGETTDREGAIHELAARSWGTVALIVLAVGFAGYALWHLALAAFGEKLESNDDVGLPTRAWYAVRGLVYVGLCVTSVKILLGARSGGSSHRKEAAQVLDWPGGRWIVGGIGVAVLGAAGWNAYQAVTKRFKDDLKTVDMSPAQDRWFTRAGIAGFLARGVVFALIGAFVVKAALEYDPKEAVGLDGALARLANEQFGPVLLAAVAAGLIAFGLFYFVRARFREV